jgi:hypothetical protein
MFEIVKSILISLAFGIASVLVMIMFIEGWGWIGTLLATTLAFGGSGYFMGYNIPQSRYYAAIFISLPFAYSFLESETILSVFELIKALGYIDDRNFYVLLPLLSIIAAYAGSWIGFLNQERRASHPNHKSGKIY